MKIYRIRTNYINPIVLFVFWMFPLSFLFRWSFFHVEDGTSFHDYLRNHGWILLSKGNNDIYFYLFWMVLVFIIEYYRGLKYIEVKIDDEGISTNWFYARGSSTFLNFGRRVEKIIKWDEIARFDVYHTLGIGLTQGMWIQTRNDSRRYCIWFLMDSKYPKNYKAMKADFEAHYEAYKNSLQ